MTHVIIDLGIVEAIALSIAFIGVMLSFTTTGILFYVYKTTSEKREKIFLLMASLILGWAIFLILNLQLSSSADYNPLFFVYSTAHMLSIFLGTIILIVFWFLFSKLQKVLNKKSLIVMGIFVILSILMRIILPFIKNHYLSLIQRIIIIIPLILGFSMIIKSAIGRHN